MYFNDDCKSLEQINVVLKSGVFDVSLCDGVDVPHNTNAQAYLGGVLLLRKSMNNEPLVAVMQSLKKEDIGGGMSLFLCYSRCLIFYICE